MGRSRARRAPGRARLARRRDAQGSSHWVMGRAALVHRLGRARAPIADELSV